MKKLILVSLLIATLLVSSNVAYANDRSKDASYSIVPTEGTPAKGNIGWAEGFASPTRSTSVTYWYNQITKTATNQVRVYGKTNTSTITTKVENYIVLQQWNGSTWVTYNSYCGSTTNTNSCISSSYKTVSRDKYYRIKSYHRAYSGSSIIDEKVIYSSYIYVD